MKIVISQKQTLPIDSTDTLHLEMVLTCSVVNPLLAKDAFNAFLACHLRKAYTEYMKAGQSGKKYPAIDTPACIAPDLVVIEMVQVHCKSNKAVNGNKFQRSEIGCALEDTVSGDVNEFIRNLWATCFAMCGVDTAKKVRSVEFESGQFSYDEGMEFNGNETSEWQDGWLYQAEKDGYSNDPSPIPQGDDKF